MAKLIAPNGVISFTQPANGKHFSLKELQEAVEGYIEIVRLENDLIMVVNEEGRLRNLPFNESASALAKQSIVGRVLICKDNEVK